MADKKEESGYVEFSFGENDTDFSTKKEKYKGNEGRTDRMSLAWWPGFETGEWDFSTKPKFVGCDRVYIEGVGYVLAKNAEIKKIANADVKRMAATIVIQWPTNSKGDVDKMRLKEALDAKDTEEYIRVLPFFMSKEKYQFLLNLHRETPLGEKDVRVLCTDNQFQKMAFSTCQDSILRKLISSETGQHAEILKALQDKIRVLAESIREDMAKDLSADEIRRKLSGNPVGPVSAVDSSAVDLEADKLLGDL